MNMQEEIDRHLEFHQRFGAFLNEQMAKMHFTEEDKCELEAWSERSATMIKELKVFVRTCRAE